MNHNKQKKQAGVCIDNEKAIIITASETDGAYSVLEKIKAPENFSSSSEHTMNNAKQADTLKYFKTIAGHLLGYDEVLLFGTGKSQEQLQNQLHEDAQFSNKKITIDNTEHLTDPQMIAKVRDFFKG